MAQAQHHEQPEKFSSFSRVATFVDIALRLCVIGELGWLIALVEKLK